MLLNCENSDQIEMWRVHCELKISLIWWDCDWDCAFKFEIVTEIGEIVFSYLRLWLGSVRLRFQIWDCDWDQWPGLVTLCKETAWYGIGTPPLFLWLCLASLLRAWWEIYLGWVLMTKTTWYGIKTVLLQGIARDFTGEWRYQLETWLMWLCWVGILMKMVQMVQMKKMNEIGTGFLCRNCRVNFQLLMVQPIFCRQLRPVLDTWMMLNSATWDVLKINRLTWSP